MWYDESKQSKLLCEILFAFCVTALKIKTFLVLPIDCCSPDPGSQANFFGGPKIIVLIWSVCFSEGLSALGSLKVVRKKNQKSSLLNSKFSLN